MSKVLEKELVNAFKGKSSFSREELFAFYRFFEPDLNEGTFGWRVYNLKARNIIKPLKRGVYTLSSTPFYTPQASPRMLKLAKHLSAHFAGIKHCIWEATWLNEFSNHQTSKAILFIEVEKGFEEAIFYAVKDASYSDVYLNPDQTVIDLYIAESHQPIVVKKLLTRAPLVKRTENRVNFFVPSLEKLLVDVYADERLFHYLQGGELTNVYEAALRSYSINYTTLFGYAKRRELDQAIQQFMKNHLAHLAKDQMD
jgi:hypothetical protein